MKVYRTSQGNWQLNFTFESKYRTLYLGRNCSQHQMKTAAEVVKELLLLQDVEPSAELLSCMETLPTRIRSSLERFGLLRRCFGISIAELYERFLKSKCYKKNTVMCYLTSQKYLNRLFGFDTSIAMISQDDVMELHTQLSLQLSKCTMTRLFRFFKMVFKFAVEEGLLSKNLFSAKFPKHEVNEDRQFYISRDAAFRLLPFFRNDKERLAFALGRFAGLRIPSEVVGLRFKDFDLKENVIRIGKDTKTGSRQVPFFREVRDVFVTLNGEPDELVFVGRSHYSYRSFMERVLRKAGMEQWEKLWVNLRSSCITDLARLGYDERTLDSIFGNSSTVRKLHYIQFERRKAYQKVLEDNERMYSATGFTESCSCNVQWEFDLLLREVWLLRKLLVQSGISVPLSNLEKENL